MQKDESDTVRQTASAGNGRVKKKQIKFAALLPRTGCINNNNGVVKQVAKNSKFFFLFMPKQQKATGQNFELNK